VQLVLGLLRPHIYIYSTVVQVTMLLQLPLVVALISIGLYTALALISLHYFLLLYRRRRRNSYYDYNHIPGDAKFTRSKLIFFFALTVSAVLDLPLYVGCAVMGGPRDCEWDSYSYSAFWTLHRLALGGYFISLGIPLIQWTDVIYTQDDNFFSKQNSRRFLFASTACYCFLQIITSIAVFCVSDAENHASFAVSQFNMISNIFEAIFLVFIVSIWLWCGVRLQLYVMRVCFRPEAERRIIFMVNLVMLAVLLSYLLRAVMVLSLSVDYCGFYICNYVVWMIGTRWLPYLFCSFLLIYIMRRSADNQDSKSGVNISDIRSSLLDTCSVSSSTAGAQRSPRISTNNNARSTSAIPSSNRVRARTDTAGTNVTTNSTGHGRSGGSQNSHNTSRDERDVAGGGDNVENLGDSGADVVNVMVEEYDYYNDNDEAYSCSQSDRSGLLSDECLSPASSGNFSNQKYQIQGARDSVHSITSIISFLMPRGSPAHMYNPNNSTNCTDLMEDSRRASWGRSSPTNSENISSSSSSFRNVFGNLFRNSSTNSSAAPSFGGRTESHNSSNALNTQHSSQRKPASAADSSDS
jgi:hypothetical protein